MEGHEYEARSGALPPFVEHAESILHGSIGDAAVHGPRRGLVGAAEVAQEFGRIADPSTGVCASDRARRSRFREATFRSIRALGLSGTA